MSQRSERLRSLLHDYESEYAALVEKTHWIAETKRNPLTLKSAGVLRAALVIQPAKQRLAVLGEEIQAVMREIAARVERGEFDLEELLAAKAIVEAVPRWNARLDDALGDYRDAKVEEALRMS